MKIFKTRDYNDMSRTAANIVSAQVILFPKSVLGLATGDTPIGMYNQLAKKCDQGDVDFCAIKTVNLDEYVGLAREHEQSYYYFMWTHLFNKINIKRENVFLPNGQANDLEKECSDYEAIIERMGGIDLQVLGIGCNGHIGFNEPSSAFTKNTHVVNLTESTISANSRFFDKKEDVPKRAVSMGIGTIMQARRILLLCSGKQKSEILYQSLYADIDPIIPASILQLHPNVTVVADQDALSAIV